jgi:glucose-6-phosphate-specific signal transduction histidine kinase
MVDLNEDSLSEDLKISIYRIIQEQLNNIRKHARASKVQILRGTRVTITFPYSSKTMVCGFDIHSKRKGLGITNIINRAETFNGGVEIISSPRKGMHNSCKFRLNSAAVVSISKTHKRNREKNVRGVGGRYRIITMTPPWMASLKSFLQITTCL